MFYTLASKFLIKGAGEKSDFLYVFLAGSVMYVVLHWFLHLDQKTGIVEQVRKYLYYTMAVDLAIAYTLITLFAVDQIDDKKLGDNKNKSKKQYTEEENRTLMARMNESRRHQMRNHQQGQQDHQDKQDHQYKQDKEGHEGQEVQEVQEVRQNQSSERATERATERAHAIAKSDNSFNDNPRADDNRAETKSEPKIEQKPPASRKTKNDEDDRVSEKKSIFSKSDESGDTTSSSRERDDLQDCNGGKCVPKSKSNPSKMNIKRSSDKSSEHKVANKSSQLSKKVSKTASKKASNKESDNSALEDTEIPMFA
jgi:hypothetical protein